MPTRKIPSANWRKTLDEISRLYDGAIVSLDVMGLKDGPQEQVHEQPFRGITSDRTGVSFQVGKSRSHLDHRVSRPQNLSIQEMDDGALWSIEVQDDEGMRTLMRFCYPMRPELLSAAVE